MGLIA